jgi:hypothetical protein
MAQAVKLWDEDNIDAFVVDAEPGFQLFDRSGLALFVPQRKPLA